MALRHKDNPYSVFAARGLNHFLEHCWEAGNMACQYIAGCPRGSVDREVLRTAEQNLKEFFFVGIFEQLHEDIRRLLALFDIRPEELTIPHLQSTDKKEEPSNQDRELINTHNTYDIALYERWRNITP